MVMMRGIYPMAPDMPSDVAAHVAAAEMPASAIVHVCPLSPRHWRCQYLHSRNTPPNGYVNMPS